MYCRQDKGIYAGIPFIHVCIWAEMLAALYSFFSALALPPSHLKLQMDFENTVVISRKTCNNCSRILYPPIPVNEEDARAGNIPLAANERLARLLSEAGLDVTVHQSEFRAAVASGCTICKDLNDRAENWSYDDRLAQFCLPKSTPEDQLSKMTIGEKLDQRDPEHATDLVDELLVINFHADTTSVSYEIPGQEKASTKRSDPFDIKELQVSPLGAHERSNISSSYDVLALSSMSV